MTRLLVSKTAIRDLAEIERYSVDRWGKRVAAEYMSALEQGFMLLKDAPELLRQKPQVSEHFQFYRVREHFVVCIAEGGNVFVLTLKHGAMDLPERIGELEPQLLREAEILRQALRKRRR